MMNNKITNMIGFAQRAGKVQSGEYLVEKSISTGKAKIVIIPTDSSRDMALRISSFAKSKEIPVFDWGSKDFIGKAIGKPPKNSLAIIDDHFAKVIIDLLK